jgi:hypothetical protein
MVNLNEMGGIMKTKTKKLWKLTICGTKVVRYFDDLSYALDFGYRLKKYTGRHFEIRNDYI